MEGVNSVFKAVILDLDGCVYRGENPIEGVADALDTIRDMGLKLLFLTNNATRTVEEYVNKLNSMGIGCDKDEVLTSGYATSIYLAERYGRVTVLPVGGRALEKELSKMGHKVLDWRENGNPQFVVACLDFGFSYEKLKRACSAIFQGAKFVATNTDPTLPVEDRLLPGAGSIVAAISKATGKRPLVIGKPSRRIMDIALRMTGVNGSEVVVVGDRLDTDVKAGKKIGAFTVLVLTGATSLRDLEGRRSSQPNLVLNSVSDLPTALKRLGKL